MDLGPVILEAAARSDGTKRWEFIKRPDGFFAYTEDTWVDLREDGGGIDGYWQRTYSSGLFDTADVAKQDALETLPWLAEIDARQS